MTSNSDSHQFTFPRLSRPETANRQPYFKITFFLTKLPGMSDADFNRHWETVHADLTVAAKGFQDVEVLRYVQYHQTPEIKEEAKALFGYSMLPYDGCTEIYVKRLEDWQIFQKRPEFIQALGGDTRKFLKSEIAIMAGYENIIFGKAIPDLGGTDGILPKDLYSRQRVP